MLLRLGASEHQRRPVGPLDGVHFGPLFQQDSHVLRSAELAGFVQGRFAVSVPPVDGRRVGEVAEDEVDVCGDAEGGRDVEDGVAAGFVDEVREMEIVLVAGEERFEGPEVT